MFYLIFLENEANDMWFVPWLTNASLVGNAAFGQLYENIKYCYD